MCITQTYLYDMIRVPGLLNNYTIRIVQATDVYLKVDLTYIDRLYHQSSATIDNKLMNGHMSMIFNDLSLNLMMYMNTQCAYILMMIFN